MDNLNSRTRALIIYNPEAGQAASLKQDIQEATQIWNAGGWIVDSKATSGPGDAARIARQAAQDGYNVVVAAGGDGTVNEVANGLAGTSAALAPLPVGTVNVWAREIGLPLQPRAAATALLDAQVRVVDLGKAGDRYFLLMAGIGFDAAVTAKVGSQEKRRLGALAYILRAFGLSMRFRGVRMQITMDGRSLRTRALMVVLGNSQLYGGVIKFTARASLDDGLLDVCIIKGNTLRGAPLRLLSILLRRASLDPKIEYHRARNVRIETAKQMPVQVDGDHIGSTPMRFESAPGALHALLPPTLPADLLRAEGVAPRRAWRRMLGWFSRNQPTASVNTPAESEEVKR